MMNPFKIFLRRLTEARYAKFNEKLQTLRQLKKYGAAKNAEDAETNREAMDMVCYLAGTAILMGGLTYAAVPAYRMFCQATSLGGTIGGGSRRIHKDSDKIDMMKVVKNRLIKIRFVSGTSGSMPWIFKPLQSEIWVHPGETALAFYSAKNPTKYPIVGISTYNVIPYDCGKFFSKIQCFCFEEQMLNPDEELDMPVFFYIDPDFAEAPEMEYVDEITLGYTFFESQQGLELPQPLSGQNFVIPKPVSSSSNVNLA